MARVLSLGFLIGFSAAIALAIGPFLPMIGVRILADNTYWELSKTGAVIMLVGALLTLALAIRGWFRAYALVGLIVLGVLAYTLYQINERRDTMQRDLESGMAGTPLRSLSVGLVKSIKLDYGMAVMAGGGVLLLAAGLMNGRLSLRRRTEASGNT